MKNILIIGGGTGTFTLLAGLRKLPANNSVIVSTADDGGSTGRLRKDLGVIPPGDIRQCLVGLSYTDENFKNLFSYRFEEGDLRGHTVGNILIAALQKITGSVEQAIAESAKLLNVKGEVVPVTLYPTVLSAVYSDGRKVLGEHNIDEQKPNKRSKRQSRIKSLQLKPSGPVNPRALRMIADADAIVFGPGDLYTSTVPNLLVKKVAQAVQKAKAKKILVTNLMTKRGQSEGYKASDFVIGLEKYLGSKALDAVIINTKKPSVKWLARHRKAGSEFVEPDVKALAKFKLQIISQPLISENINHKSKGDILERSFLRHDSDMLAKLIYEFT